MIIIIGVILIIVVVTVGVFLYRHLKKKREQEVANMNNYWGESIQAMKIILSKFDGL